MSLLHEDQSTVITTFTCVGHGSFDYISNKTCLVKKGPYLLLVFGSAVTFELRGLGWAIIVRRWTSVSFVTAVAGEKFTCLVFISKYERTAKGVNDKKFPGNFCVCEGFLQLRYM